MNATLISPDKVATIFLDIDGIVMPTGDKRPAEKTVLKRIEELFPHLTVFDFSTVDCGFAQASFLDPTAVQHLHTLIEKVKAVMQLHIVISSDWRKNFNSVSNLQAVFRQYSFSNHIQGKTGDFGYHTARGREIQHYRQTHNVTGPMVILDDDDFCRRISSIFPKHFVHVKHTELLSEADCDKAYHILTQMDPPALPVEDSDDDSDMDHPTLHLKDSDDDSDDEDAANAYLFREIVTHSQQTKQTG